MVEIKEGLTEGEEILEFTPASTKDNQDPTGPYGVGPGGAMDTGDSGDGSTR